MPHPCHADGGGGTFYKRQEVALKATAKKSTTVRANRRKAKLKAKRKRQRARANSD
jgi:hypothetical protein